MSLTKSEKEATVRELHENLAQSDLTLDEIAQDLGTTPEVIEEVSNLRVKSIEQPWVLRNYLIKKIISHGKEPISFTVLVGDYHNYSFLNSDFIDKGKME
ncbi:DUF2316 family protein [Companilactobacillus insicii]|uniref:DUF2316 family protein n=1 Tax=Companilactobacillus insicii TaxID=1732567 RepID=UPI000F7B12C5|nr:DUF2316 family protein [Companilactobacillus insicii]